MTTSYLTEKVLLFLLKITLISLFLDAESLIQTARQHILRTLAAGVGPDHSLMAFIPIDSIPQLPEHILELFIECMNDSHAYPHLLELALRLNSPSVVRQLSVGDLRREVGFWWFVGLESVVFW